MKFDFDRKDDLNALLHVHIEQSDYANAVEKTIKVYRKSANIPGFRKGHVPASLIKKQYGQAILVEEVNKLLQEGVNGYVREQDLELLGQPLPIEDREIDWDGEEFKFSFELGLAPKVQLALDPKKDILPFKSVEVGDEQIGEEIDSLRRRYGQVTQVEEIGENDYVRGKFIDENQEDAHEHNTGFRLDENDNAALRDLFLGAAKGEERIIEVKLHFNDESHAARILGIDEAHLEEHGDRFRFTIEGIVRVTPAEMNKEELFSKVFSDVEDENSFRQRVAEQVKGNYSGDAERMFENALVDYILENTTIELPDAFLQKWMRTATEEPLTDEQAQEQYPAMARGLKWQMIQNTVARENEIKLEEDDLRIEAREVVREQMASYGQTSFDDSMLDSIGQNLLNDGEQIQKLQERAIQRKVMDILKLQVGRKEEKVSPDDFYGQH